MGKGVVIIRVTTFYIGMLGSSLIIPSLLMISDASH